MKLLNGILGTGVNKVGNVIGATWKGIAYIRQYAIPKNPNTVAQQAVRAKMKIVGELFSTFLATICQKFWDPIAVKMSGYNMAVQNGMKNPATIPPLKNTVLCVGNLEGVAAASGSYDEFSGDLTIVWNKTCLGNGLATDKAVVAIYDDVHTVGFVADSGVNRSVETIIINVGVGRTVTDLTGWLWFYRGTAAPYLQSPSIGFDPSTP